MSEARTALDGLRLDRDDAPADRPRRRWWLWALLVVLLAGAAYAIARRPVVVRTTEARPAAATGPRILLNASGYVTARRDATVSSKVTGKVVEVLIEEGMKVEAGQVLARLDDTNVKASLALAEALLAAAKAALAETRVRVEEAQRELRRTTALVGGRIATEADLDRAEAEVKSLEARLDKLAADATVSEREVGVRRQEVEDTVIRAPFAGIVTVKNAQPGEMISPISAGGGFTRTGICTLVDMASLEIEVDVNESFINRVTPGQGVEAALDAYPDWKLPCKVIAVIPTADRQKSTVKVRIGFDQLDPRILPEMAVRVAFLGAGPAAPGEAGFLIPKAALVSGDGRDAVWVIEQGRAVRRTVTKSGTAGDELIVSAGLKAGDRLAVEGLARLREGTRVTERASRNP
jgi:HlyD family secretion protein